MEMEINTETLKEMVGSSYAEWYKQNPLTKEITDRMTWGAFLQLQIGILDEIIEKSSGGGNDTCPRCGRSRCGFMVR